MSCNTKQNPYREHYIWRIVSSSLYSKPIAKWELILCPYKFVGGNTKLTGNSSRVSSFRLAHPMGVKSRTQNGNFAFRENSFFGWDDFIPREKWTENHTFFETLRIRCEMNIDHGIDINRGSMLCKEPEPQPSANPNTVHGAVYKELYSKKTFSDVILQVEDKEFHVHKAILAAHSLVFENMFMHNMKVKLEQTVQIVDTTASVLELMIQYIYCGDTFVTNETVSLEVLVKLYDCADKYNISRLMLKCSEYLLTRLNEEHVCEIIITAFLQNDTKLVDFAIRFIINNSLKVMTSPKWAQLLEQYPDIVQQIIEQEKQIVNSCL